MPHNGDCIQIENIHELRQSVEAVRALAPNFDALLPELIRFRDEVHALAETIGSVKEVLAALTTRLMQVEKSGDETKQDLKDYKDDQVDVARRALSNRAQDIRAVRSAKRTFVYALIGGIILALTAGVCGRVSSHVQWNPHPTNTVK